MHYIKKIWLVLFFNLEEGFFCSIITIKIGLDMEIDKIYLGDCLELMKEIPDKSVDCIICDLPYGITDCEFDSVIPFDLLWEQYNRIIKPKGNIVLFASGRFLFQLYNSQPNKYRYDLIWKKSKCGSPLTIIMSRKPTTLVVG